MSDAMEYLDAELERAGKEVEQLKSTLAATQAELAKFHEAMERERSPKWSEELKDLADWLDGHAKDMAIHTTPDIPEQLSNAARQLRYMADCFTLKANFVPSELKIKELTETLRQSEAGAAVMRQSISDFVHNVKHSHVPGWGDVSRDTVADNSFKELSKSLSTEAGKSLLAELDQCKARLVDAHDLICNVPWLQEGLPLKDFAHWCGKRTQWIVEGKVKE